MGQLSELISNYRQAKTLARRLAIVSELICEVGPELEAYAKRRARTQEIAEEVYQETLVVIATNLEKYKGNSDNEFRSWCYTIIRRKLANYMRDEKPDNFESFDESNLRDIIAAGQREISPGVEHDLKYALSLLAAAKPVCAVLLWVYHVLGWTYQAIAEAIGKSYDAVRVQLNRCLHDAQSLMEKSP
jgi:RNA polymerase sigma factor (sigma-70 family)